MMTHACHAICMLPPPDAALTMGFAKNTQHDMSKVSRLPRKIQMDRSKAPWNMMKNANHLLKRTQKHRACHTERLLTRYEAHGNPTQNGVARRLKPPKVTAFAALPIGTAIATSWRTVANDCEALRTAAGVKAASSQQVPIPIIPDPQSKTRTFRYALGKNRAFIV